MLDKTCSANPRGVRRINRGEGGCRFEPEGRGIAQARLAVRSSARADREVLLRARAHDVEVTRRTSWTGSSTTRPSCRSKAHDRRRRLQRHHLRAVRLPRPAVRAEPRPGSPTAASRHAPGSTAPFRLILAESPSTPTNPPAGYQPPSRPSTTPGPGPTRPGDSTQRLQAVETCPGRALRKVGAIRGSELTGMVVSE
jgi:hypothetical protein